MLPSIKELFQFSVHFDIIHYLLQLLCRYIFLYIIPVFSLFCIEHSCFQSILHILLFLFPVHFSHISVFNEFCISYCSLVLFFSHIFLVSVNLFLYTISAFSPFCHLKTNHIFIYFSMYCVLFPFSI